MYNKGRSIWVYKRYTMFQPVQSVQAANQLFHPASDQDATRKKTESTASAFFTGLLQSKVTRALLITGAVVGLTFILASNPVGWVATALGVSTLVAAAIFAAGGLAIFGGSLFLQHVIEDGSLSFEVSALYRLTKEKDYNEISVPGWVPAQSAGKLYLGSLPNRLNFSEGEEILKDHGAILSINERWEKDYQGFSVPYRKDDWEKLNIEYQWLEAIDHRLLNIKTMSDAAEWIHSNLSAGKNVYVHCRAGVGRSATALAAFLMAKGRDAQGNPLTIEAICAGIKGSREHAEIWRKLQALRDFDESLKAKGVERPARSDAINSLIAKLDNGAKKIPRKDVEAVGLTYAVVPSC